MQRDRNTVLFSFSSIPLRVACLSHHFAPAVNFWVGRDVTNFCKPRALQEAALARIMRRIISILPFLFLLQAVPSFAQELAPLDPIEQVVSAKLMNPYPDENFRPERILSRAELASILVKTFQLDQRTPQQQAAIPLQDVPSSHWAYTEQLFPPRCTSTNWKQ